MENKFNQSSSLVEHINDFSSAAMGDVNLLSSPSADNRPELYAQQGQQSLKDVTAAKCRSEWKDRMHRYGVVYNVMTGNTVSTSHNEPSIGYSNSVDYCEGLYHDESGKDICTGLNDPVLEYGSCYNVKVANDKQWFLTGNETSLNELTTFDVQSTIAAALNSRRLLVWLIGVNDNRMVTGCKLDRTQRDIFQQAFDFCISTEFVPELLPSFVNIRFLKVSGGREERYVIEISTTCVTKQVFQLSSGRFFICNKNMVKQVTDLNTVYQSMKRSHAASANSSSNTFRECSLVSLYSNLTTLTIGLLAGFYVRKLL